MGRPPRSTLFPYTTLFRSCLRARTTARCTDWSIGPKRPRTTHSPSADCAGDASVRVARSEEHTSELQSLRHLVCRLLLEKKKEISGNIGFHQIQHHTPRFR